MIKLEQKSDINPFIKWIHLKIDINPLLKIGYCMQFANDIFVHIDLSLLKKMTSGMNYNLFKRNSS